MSMPILVSSDMGILEVDHFTKNVVIFSDRTQHLAHGNRPQVSERNPGAASDCLFFVEVHGLPDQLCRLSISLPGMVPEFLVDWLRDMNCDRFHTYNHMYMCHAVKTRPWTGAKINLIPGIFCYSGSQKYFPK